MNSTHLKLVFFFAGLVVISYMVLIVFGDNGLRDLNAMKEELRDLKAENDKLQQKNIEMHRKIKRLKEDPIFIENIARQELKMIGKDEIVFKFKEDSDVTNRIPAQKNQLPNTGGTMDPILPDTPADAPPQTVPDWLRPTDESNEGGQP